MTKLLITEVDMGDRKVFSLKLYTDFRYCLGQAIITCSIFMVT